MNADFMFTVMNYAILDFHSEMNGNSQQSAAKIK